MKLKELPERISDITEIYSKLISLGIHKRFDGMNIFYEHINLFVKEGQSASGKIKLPEIDRILYYQLITKSMNPSIVWLKYVGKKLH
jgi:hypothetical protein